MRQQSIRATWRRLLKIDGPLPRAKRESPKWCKDCGRKRRTNNHKDPETGLCRTK